jgi:hypothetical protein
MIQKICFIFLNPLQLDFGHWRELLSRLLASILDPFLNGGILNAYHLKLDDQVFFIPRGIL